MANKPDFEQLAAAQKANTEVLMAVMKTGFEGVQRIADLNMAATRELFDSTIASANTLMSAKDINDAARLNQTMAQPNVERMVDYSRRLYELMAQMQKEMTGIIESQYSQFAKNAAGAIDKTKASAPVGGDVFAAAMKSMLDATNQVFDQMTAATKQITDATEANVKATTTATSKAVGAGSRRKK
ncbi:MAG TPA: phasin family protein [Rhodocyclaceae bacterium]